MSQGQGAPNPKLYANKPKKAHLKQYQQQSPPSPSPSSFPSSSMATTHSSSSTTPTTPSPPPPPPPQPPKESFARRYKFVWPLLLTVNIAVGAYVFMRTKKKGGDAEVNEVTKASSTPISTTVPASSVNANTSPPAVVTEPIKLREPIPEDKQRELFKWILEEKRKMKPKDKEEKKRIDEEKAVIKQFLRAKSIPSL